METLHIRLLRLLWPACLITWATVLLFLSLYNLERFPVTWFDEGSHLHVPKTLVQHGVYADRSSEGFRYFGPTTGVGPTVMLPIAAVFKLTGIGLLQARVVMVAYLLVAILIFGAVARTLYGNWTALLATALLVTAPGINLFYLGRQVLGEVPALAFMMLGVLLWSHSIESSRRQRQFAIWAAIAFGLTALTKNQFALILMPTFVVMVVADRVYYHRLSLAQTVVPLFAVVGGTILGQITPLLPLIGTDEFFQTLSHARQASAGAIFVFMPDRILSSLRFLLSADLFSFWAIPGLIYGAALVRRYVRQSIQHAFLLTFALCGLSWYAFGSIGWPRYAFPALAVAALFVARLLTDVMGAALRDRHDVRARARLIAIVVVCVIPLVAGLVQTSRSVVTAHNDSPQQMAAYLNRNVPTDTIIETWEPEMGFLTDHAFHYPPSGWLDRAVRSRWLGGSLLPDYDPLAVAAPTYVLIGPFGKYTQAYESFLRQTPLERVHSVGEYELYRVGQRR